jgi:deoxyribose-phosphate aldolase
VSRERDRGPLRSWAAEVARWTEAGHETFPERLRPAAFGLQRPGGQVAQLPWGVEAAERFRRGASLAPYLDHTLLRPGATPEEVRRLGAEARTHLLGGACVYPSQVRTLVEALSDAPVVPVAVVGFPSGAHRPEVKAHEARLAVADGAREVDVVAALGALRTGDVEKALEDAVAVVEAVQPWPVKLILETGLLEPRAVVLGAGLALFAGCAAVKTSTGTGPPGARVEDVTLLRAVVGTELAVKASGGIRTRDDAVRLIAAGASRLGTSASLSLL